jgi:hypothetical protein
MQKMLLATALLLALFYGGRLVICKVEQSFYVSPTPETRSAFLNSLHLIK